MSPLPLSTRRIAATLLLGAGYAIACTAPTAMRSVSPVDGAVPAVVSFTSAGVSSVARLCVVAAFAACAVALMEIAKGLVRSSLSAHLTIVLAQAVVFFDAIRAFTPDWWVYLVKFATSADFRAPWDGHVPVSDARWPLHGAIGVIAAMAGVWTARPAGESALTQRRAMVASMMLVAGYSLTFFYPLIARNALRWPEGHFAVPSGRPVSVGLLFALAGLAIVVTMVLEVAKAALARSSMTPYMLVAFAQLVLAADLIRAWAPDWWYVLTRFSAPIPSVQWPLIGGMAVMVTLAAIRSEARRVTPLRPSELTLLDRGRSQGS